ILSGGNGNDILDGVAGTDAMTGGSGDDNYVIDNAGDTVIEAPDGGFDTEQSSVDRSIDANVEQLILVAGAQNATGDGRANTLNGNNANNVLDGGRGPDSMAGAGGDDTYKVDSPIDQVRELAGQGTDTVVSQVSQI